MPSRMAPPIRRSRSVGVISPRSACSRKTEQMCWSAASTVNTVITVLTSIPDIPPGTPGWSWALVLTVGLPRAARVYLHAGEEQDRQLASTLGKMARRELRRSSGARVATNRTQTSKGQERELAIMAGRQLELGTHGVERVTRIELALSAWEADVLPLNYTREVPAGSGTAHLGSPRHRTGRARWTDRVGRLPGSTTTRLAVAALLTGDTIVRREHGRPMLRSGSGR